MDLTQTNEVNANEILVSVITVTYNAEKFIENCIKNVIGQKLNNVEHIIVDGISTDGTVSIIKNYESHIAYFLSEADAGIYDAMNKAVRFCKGRWILFLGADDFLLEGFSKMLHFLKKENCIYYGDYVYNGEKLGGKFSTYRLAKTNICHQNIFYPKIVFDKYKYDNKYIVCADHYLNMQCWADKNFEWEYRNLLISNYSLGGFSFYNDDLEFEKDRHHNIKTILGIQSYWRFLFREWKRKRKP